MLNSVSTFSSLNLRGTAAPLISKHPTSFSAALENVTKSEASGVSVSISNAAKDQATRSIDQTGLPSLDLATITAAFDRMRAQKEVDGAGQEYLGRLDASRTTYLNVVSKAEAQGGFDQPGKFVSSLSEDKLQALQHVQSLASPIRPSSLDDEGALNLLLPRTMARDIDRNGVTNVGLANMITFPPYDAPPEFSSAWDKATQGLDWATRTQMGEDMWAAGPGEAVWSRGLSTETASLTYQPIDYAALLDRTISNVALRINYQPNEQARNFTVATLEGLQAVKQNLTSP